MSDLLKRLANLSPEKQALLLKKLRAGTPSTATSVTSLPPLERLPEGARLPLSFAQQRLWFLEQLEPGTSRYSVPAAVRLEGALDVAVLEQAFAELTRRHESLRTLFRQDADSAEQVILPPQRQALRVVDLTSLAGAERQAEVLRQANATAQRPFDLQRGPLFITTLLRLGEREHLLVLNVHHIVSDAWSTSVLVREVGQLYAAFSQGQPSPLPVLPVRYADYAHWQRQWLRGEELERQLSYWRQQLEGAPARLELPTDRPRPTAQTFHGAALPVRYSRELSEALKALAAREGVTPFMLLLTAFQLVLGRYAGQDDVSVGSSIAGRRLGELEGLIGFFANMLVLRTDLGGDPTFRELLQRVRQTTLGAYGHQDVPFEKLVEELKPERNLGHSPLFQVVFAFLNAPPVELSLPGLSMRPVVLDTVVAKFDLELAFMEQQGCLLGNFVYNRDLFDAATIERLAGHLETLLHQVKDAPGARLSQLSLLTAAERQQVLEDWNGATRALPEPALAHRLFEAQARRAPDAPALRFGEETLTYGELNARANQLARHLRRVGVGPEIRVALCLERSAGLVVAQLAVLKAGGAFLPLDPGLPSERLDYIASDAMAPVLLTDSSLEHLMDRRGYVLRLDADWGRVERESEDDLDTPVDGDQLAYVIYTSGSTGRPKGTLLRHQGLCNTALRTVEFMDLGPGSRLLQFFSSAFDASISEIFPALLSGATLVLAPREELLPGAPLLKTVADHAITTLKLTPTVLSQLEPEGLQGVRTLIVAGEACAPELAQRFAPGRRFVNAYGPTEATVCATVNTRVDPRRVTLGRPFANARACVLDAHLAPVPPGVPGELYLGGMGLARGYLGRPDLTAERFVPDPFATEPGLRLYRTGDRARWLPDGELEYLGRVDFQVKLRGFRIELGEIEAVLLQQPGVREAVVVLREDPPALKRLVAYVAPPTGEEAPDPAVLRLALQERLPDYMLPAAFVCLEALPTNSSGKVDRKALPAPDGTRAAQAKADYAAPVTPVEEQLADIWARVLGLERVGIHDNFFDLGGDSIISLQVVARARQAGLVLSTRDLFQHQTVALLAKHVQAASESTDEQGVVTGPVPLTPLQQHLFAHDATHAHHFNQSLLLECRVRQEASRLETALRHLVEHHDALRLRFFQHEDSWLQENVSVQEAPFRLLSVDLGALPAAEQSAALEAEAARLQSTFALGTPPLFRAALFDLGVRGQRLLLVAHHLVVDVVSWRVLLEDLESACAQHERGEPVRLPAKSTSFQAWTRRLHAHAQSEALAAEAPLWLDAARNDVAPLPTDGAGANVRDSEQSVRVAMDAEETRVLLQEVPGAWRARINEVLLTALGRALAEWTGQPRALVHLEGHGREDLFAGVDTSRTVGWFTSMVPVLLPVPAQATTGECLRAVRDSLRRMPNHGLGGGLLKWMGPEAVSRALKAQPLPQVAFNYLGQLDATAAASERFARATEAIGPSSAPSGERLHVLEVNGSVTQGRLQFALSYSTALHHAATIEALGQGFARHLRALIAERHSDDAHRLSPGDFPLAALDRPALDALVAQAPSGVEDIYPLSPMQQGILFHALLSPSSSVYFQQLAWTVDSPLDQEAFLAAWRECLRLHPILRSSFHWEGLDTPLQVVHACPVLPVHTLDWRELPKPEQRARMEQLLADDQKAGVDLRHAPLLRLTVILLGAQRTRFLWSHHHLLVDGWSLGLLMRDVFSLYDTLRAGGTPPTVSRPPFRDYIAWLQRRDASAAESFWRASLQDFNATTPLPADTHQPATSQDTVEGALSEQATTALQAFARQHQLTLHTLALASWAVVLARHARVSDVVFGNTVAGRPPELAGSDGMVGLFINSLPVRIPLPDGDAPLGPWLQSIQARQLEQRQYEHSPLVQVQALSGVPRGTPLFDSLLVFENYPLDETLLESPSMRVSDIHGFERSNYPLTVSVLPGAVLRLRAVFATPRFAAGPLRRVLRHWIQVLEALPASGRLDDLALLTPVERRQVLLDWNATTTQYPRSSTLSEVFSQVVTRAPDAVAVEFGDTALTYAQLDARANRLAWRLRGLGVGTDSRVALAVERSLELIISLVAILKAGGAYVPLDPSYPRERLAAMLEDARPRVLLTQRAALAKLPSDGVHTVVLEELDLSAQPTSTPPCAAHPESLAYIDFTSGSTGRPKGVGTQQSAVLRTVFGVDYAHLGPDETFLLIAPVSFDASTLELWAPLLHGGRLVVFPPHSPSDVYELETVLVKHGVTTLHLTAGLFTQVVDSHPRALRTVKQLLTGGDVVSAPHVQRVLETLRIPVTACYGPTEGTLFTSCHRMTTPGDVGTGVPIGRPIGNTRVYVLDANGQPVPPGLIGELFAGGDGVARGYVGQPALTAERFVPDPFSGVPGARLYRTGDLARWREDGVLEFLGRADAQVKLRGYRIELGEVEAALLTHSPVASAVAVMREDVPGDQRLVAYVVPRDGQTVDIPLLRSHLQQRLPEYMVPSAFVGLDALPLTANAKVDRKALPPPESLRAPEVEYVAPRGETEQRLAAIWREVLRVERVGLHDNFFLLGGHSLLATQALSRIRTAFNVELPLRALFEAPTLLELAARLGAFAASDVPALRPTSRSGPLPMSFAQQRLWFLDQLEPGNASYNIPTALQLEGHVNADALQHALDALVERHESLRTVFRAGPEGAEQRILPRVSVPLERGSVSTALPGSEQQREALRLATGEARRPFDLARGPLLRATLLDLEEARHVLLLTMHHIVSDGWSMGVLVRELAALYDAFTRGQPSPLPPLALQYADYSAWQRLWLQGEALDRQRAWWREQLSDVPVALELPTDKPRPATRSFRGAHRSFRMPALSARLKDFSQQQGATPFMVLLAVFHTLLHRYSGQDDIRVGTPIAGRGQTELEGLIGVFINTLVLRADLRGNPTFLQLLEQVRANALGAYAHQDVPFEKLVEDLNPQRDLSTSPLFQAMLVLQNAPMEALRLPGLHLRPLEVESHLSKFDLTLLLVDGPEGLVGTLEYATDLFEPATAERMVGHFGSLLEHALSAPTTRLGDLALLTAVERRQLLVGWNDTRADFPRERTVNELIALQAARVPDAVAVEADDARLTYAQLDARANQLANHLRTLGVGPEVRVGLFLERTAEMVVALLGVLKAGGAYVPFDTTHPEERVAFMLADSGVAVVLTRRALVERLPPHAANTLCLDSDWDLIARQDSAAPVPSAGPEHLAYVLYTSGSTGRPKGALIDHRGVVNYLAWCARTYPGEGGYGAPVHSPLAFDLTVTSLLLPLARGQGVRLVSEQDDVEGLAAALREHRGYALVKLTPSHLLLLSRLLSPGEAAGATGAFVIGGEALTHELLAFWRTHAPATRLFNEYGPTETVVGCCVYEVDGKDAPPALATGPVPIGRPIANVELHVLDTHLGLVPVGVPGELYIGGVPLARGYGNRPELTAERFVPHPFSDVPGARLYRTGDRVRRRPDGVLEFLGRIDSQVKLRGYRIELGEVEAVLAQHPNLREAVAVVREDAPGDQRLVAYVVPQEGQAVDIAALRAFLQQRLPEYMVPAAFVGLDALPLTANAKVDRKALPRPGGEDTVQGARYLEPRTDLERTLASVWAELLGVERVGLEDSFFDRGGHSLLATQLVSRLRSAFGVEVPLRTLFEAPTLAAFAARTEALLQGGHASRVPALQRVPRDGALPLSFAQQRLWFLDQLDPGGSVYHLPTALRIDGALDRAVLRRAFDALVARHESLRTTFRSEAGEARQVIHAPGALTFEEADLSSWPGSERREECERRIREEARRPFDLSTGPLLRVAVLTLTPSEHVLLLTMHHIISDGWSVGVLVRELAALYDAFVRGEPSPLPELPVQYADYTVWQRQWLRDDALREQLDWWGRRLAGAPAVLELPTDRPRPPQQSFRGARHGFTLAPATARRLHALAQREGATPFMLLLTAFQVLLARYAGQDDISVGSPIAGRRLAELEGLIGFFVNTLVLRTRVNAEVTFRELLRQVRDSTLEDYAHQDLPFEQLVEVVRPERDMSVPPLFQVMLVVQNAPVSALRLPELRLRPLEVDSATARFDLTLQFAEGADGFIGSLEYNTDLFDASTAGRLAEHFQVLLEAALQTPDTRVGRLALLTAPERHQLLKEWNTLQTHFAQQGTLHGLFEDQAARTPHARALSFEDTHLTYGELNARANQLAAWLRARGAGPESRIGLYLERSAELVVGLLAILKAGAAYVPMDPASPRDRLAFMLEDAGVPLLLTQTSLAPNLPPHGAHVLCLDAEGPTLATLPVRNVDAGTHEEHLAYVIYTSGSTGRPKGSLVTHANVLRLFSATRPWYDFGERDVWTLFHSSAFDFSVWELWGALLYGGRLVVVPYWVSRSPADFHALLRREAVTVLNQTPSAFRQLIQHEQSLERPPPLALRYVIFGGEALDFRGLQPWFALHGDSQPRLINMYGITETTVHVTYRPLSQEDASGTASVVGVPIPDLQAFILDPSLEPVPVGIPGELYIGGRGLARGYLGRPGLTAERFIPHPFSTTPGARLYKTGDRARFRADGQIEYLGRTDFQVKLRGFRIELGEIEAVLEQQPGLRQALVLAREDRAGDKRLVAYVVPAAGHGVDTATLRQELKAKLPEYMVPSAFVTLEALPLTSNGKVDRKALPAPDASATPASRYEAPRTPVEQRLAELWRDVLGVERVGVTDSFFELGGHSLLAVQVMSRIRVTFGVDLPLRALFEHPNVEALARALEQLGGDALAGVSRGEDTREEAPARSVPRRPTPVGRVTGPASMAQRRWLSYAGSNPNRPKSAGNVPRCVRIKGRLDVEALERALTTLVERHEILRTHYARSDDGFAFQVPPLAPVRLEQLDFTGLPREQCEEAVRQRVYQDAQTPFDLMAPPMFRAWLYQLGPEEHMLLVLTHHIAWDGWSEAIVLQEVTRAYQAYVRGEHPRLPELRIQYSDFAWWQHEQMQGEHLESLESYWRRHLAEGVTMVDFPLDRPRPTTRTYNALTTTASFPVDLSAAIKVLCHREGVTLYMMAMAAYQALLALRSGARDVTVFSNIGSRDHLEVENLVGCFTNVILIRTNLEGDPTFQELLTRVRDAVLGALAHSALPYQRVLDMIGMNPDSKSARTFPGLNMQNFQKSGGPRPSADGIQLDRVNVPQGGSLMVNMFFFVSESEDQRVSLMAQANGDLYDARTVDRIVEDFQRLLAAGCADPNRRLSALLP